MDDWEKFNETTLPEKEDFFSDLNGSVQGSICKWKILQMQITCMQRVCKDFEIKNLVEYHDLYFTSDMLLLADVFENFRKMCLKIYHLEPVKFLSAPELAWPATLKKASKIRIIN